MSNFKGVLDELFKEQEITKEKLKGINSVIFGIQDLCDHDWIYEWSEYHGSKRDHYKCQICRKEKAE